MRPPNGSRNRTPRKALKEHVGQEAASPEGSQDKKANKRPLGRPRGALKTALAVTGRQTPSTLEPEKYLVDHIVAKKVQGGVMLYRVRWQGFSAADDTWEPIEHFDGPAIVYDAHADGKTDPALFKAMALSGLLGHDTVAVEDAEGSFTKTHHQS